MDKKNAKKISNTLKPAVQVGKNGITKEIVKEIFENLKKHKLIKIKCLRYHLESVEGENTKAKMKSTADKLAKETKSELISVVGFNITLAKNLRSLKEEEVRFR